MSALATSWCGNRLHRYEPGRGTLCGSNYARVWRNLDWREAHSPLCAKCFTPAERHERMLADMARR